jgi:hypothetical protein
MATTLWLKFTDGQEEEVKLTARTLIEAERKFGAKLQDAAVEGQFYAAWHRLGRQGDFETWVDSVDDYNIREGSAVPTLPAASDDS